MSESEQGRRTDEETRALLDAHPHAMALIERMRGQLARMEGQLKAAESLIATFAKGGGEGKGDE